MWKSFFTLPSSLDNFLESSPFLNNRQYANFKLDVAETDKKKMTANN